MADLKNDNAVFSYCFTFRHFVYFDSSSAGFSQNSTVNNSIAHVIRIS